MFTPSCCHNIAAFAQKLVLAMLVLALICTAAICQSSQPTLDGTPVAPAARGTPSFYAEVKSAETAQDRNGKIQFLRNAIALRPGDPQNILLEFKIATLIGQTNDIAHNQEASPRDALPLFEEIIRRYDHKVYYQTEPGLNNKSPELVVPRSAILAASILRGLFHENEKSRDYVRIAMDDLAWTYKTRKAEWESAPRPLMPDEPRDPKKAMEEFAADVRAWEARRREASAGNVMGHDGQPIVEAAVMEFGLSFGPQHPGDVAAVMQHVIDDFPNTPMAVVANEHIRRAHQLVLASVGARPAMVPTTSHVPESRPSAPQRPSEWPLARRVILWSATGGLCAIIIWFIARKRR